LNFNVGNKLGFAIIAMGLIVPLAGRTIVRNTNFIDNVTLTCHDAAAAVDDAFLENSCGASLFQAGNIKEAQVHLEKSVQLAPYSFLNWYSLGTLMGTRAERESDKAMLAVAEKYLQTSIQNAPAIPYAYEVLGYLYASYENCQTASIFLTDATKRFPSNHIPWLYLAIAESKCGNTQSATQAIHAAYKLNPSDKDVQKIYGVLK
jgi:predicted Zn-dependent protease